MDFSSSLYQLLLDWVLELVFFSLAQTEKYKDSVPDRLIRFVQKQLFLTLHKSNYNACRYCTVSVK